MPTRTVNLPDHLDRFLETRIVCGRFGDTSEAVCEGLRLLEEHERENEAKIECLRAAAKEGFDAVDSGDYLALNSEEEVDAFLDQVHKDVTAELALERKLA